MVLDVQALIWNDFYENFGIAGIYCYRPLLPGRRCVLNRIAFRPVKGMPEGEGASWSIKSYPAARC
jgi:hypothetical protein